ncbi:MAG TPA: tetratricopeptide repeat protein [Candidatus Obscuribacterales bacterium]
MKRTFSPIGFALFVTACVASGASAQGIVETGSLYAMPKGSPAPGGHAGALGAAFSVNLDPSRSRGRAGGTVEVFDPEDVREAERNSVALWHAAVQKEKQGRAADAEKLYRQALDLRRRIWGDRDPSLSQLLMVIGGLNERLGRLPTAESWYRDLLSTRARLHGPGTWELCDPSTRLARVLVKQEKYAEACPLYSVAFQLTERKFGSADQKTISAAVTLAETLDKAGKNAEAQAVLRKLLGLTSDTQPLPPNVPAALVSCYNRLQSSQPRDSAARPE